MITLPTGVRTYADLFGISLKIPHVHVICVKSVQKHINIMGN